MVLSVCLNKIFIIFGIFYTFEELKWHACHIILSKWQAFTDLNGALRAISNLQWSNL